jgi:hypothetical protein
MKDHLSQESNPAHFFLYIFRHPPPPYSNLYPDPAEGTNLDVFIERNTTSFAELSIRTQPEWVFNQPIE